MRICLYLKYVGHTVRSARTKKEALKNIAGEDYDVLISDIGLSDGNGWDLIREMGEWRPPFAIAMSGYGTVADRERSSGGWLSPSLDKAGILGEISGRARRGCHGSTRPLRRFCGRRISSCKEILPFKSFLWRGSVRWHGGASAGPLQHTQHFIECPTQHSSCQIERLN